MSAKAMKKAPLERTAAKPVVRTPKTREEIAREQREQRALNPGRSAVEDYLTPNSRHFGF